MSDKMNLIQQLLKDLYKEDTENQLQTDKLKVDKPFIGRVIHHLATFLRTETEIWKSEEGQQVVKSMIFSQIHELKKEPKKGPNNEDKDDDLDFSLNGDITFSESYEEFKRVMGWHRDALRTRHDRDIWDVVGHLSTIFSHFEEFTIGLHQEIQKRSSAQFYEYSAKDPLALYHRMFKGAFFSSEPSIRLQYKSQPKFDTGLKWTQVYEFLYATRNVFSHGSARSVTPSGIFPKEKQDNFRQALEKLKSHPDMPKSCYDWSSDMLHLLGYVVDRSKLYGKETTDFMDEKLSWAVCLWIPKMYCALAVELVGALKKENAITNPPQDVLDRRPQPDYSTKRTKIEA